MGCPQSKFKRRQGQEYEAKEEKNETRPSHKNCNKTDTQSRENSPPQDQVASTSNLAQSSSPRQPSPTSSLGRVDPNTQYVWQRNMSFERGFNQKREARLKLGSISEVWREKDRWDKFVEYLVPLSEGDDSDGKPMSLSRYARFLELYVKLDQLEEKEGTSEEELKAFVKHIKEHEEDFFGTERCLRCIDKAMRTQVLKNVKLVKDGKMKGGKLVYQPIYSSVLDKLNELLGSYHQTHTLKQSQTAK